MPSTFVWNKKEEEEEERISLIAFNLLSIAFDVEEKQGEKKRLLRDAISLIGLDMLMRWPSSDGSSCSH